MLHSTLSCSCHPVSPPLYSQISLNSLLTVFTFSPPIYCSSADSSLFSVPIISRKQLSNINMAKLSGCFSFLSLFYLTVLTIALEPSCFGFVVATFFWFSSYLLTIFSVFFSRFFWISRFWSLSRPFFIIPVSSQMIYASNSFTIYMLMTFKFRSCTTFSILVFRFLYSDVYFSSLLRSTTDSTCAQTQCLLSPN